MPPVRTPNPNVKKRPKLAATINTVKHLLHGQHILDRLLDGYGWDGVYHHPQMDVVLLYVDQAGVGDDNRTMLASFFSPLVHHMEQMFLTGKLPYPVERTLLTNGILIAGIDSLYQNQERVPTPHLAIHYQPNPESTFWRS